MAAVRWRDGAAALLTACLVGLAQIVHDRLAVALLEGGAVLSAGFIALDVAHAGDRGRPHRPQASLRRRRNLPSPLPPTGSRSTFAITARVQSSPRRSLASLRQMALS